MSEMLGEQYLFRTHRGGNNDVIASSVRYAKSLPINEDVEHLICNAGTILGL